MPVRDDDIRFVPPPSIFVSWTNENHQVDHSFDHTPQVDERRPHLIHRTNARRSRAIARLWRRREVSPKSESEHATSFRVWAWVSVMSWSMQLSFAFARADALTESIGVA